MSKVNPRTIDMLVSKIQRQRMEQEKWYMYANSGLRPVTIYYPNDEVVYSTQNELPS